MKPWDRKAEPFRVSWTFNANPPLYWRTVSKTWPTLELAREHAAERAAQRANYTVIIDRAIDAPNAPGFAWELVETVKSRKRDARRRPAKPSAI